MSIDMDVGMDEEKDTDMDGDADTDKETVWGDEHGQGQLLDRRIKQRLGANTELLYMKKT